MALNKMLYGFCRTPLNIAFRLLWNFKAYGLKNVPKMGGFILVSNHASCLDPPFLGVAIPRRSIRYMAKSTLFENGLVAWFFKSLGAFPIKRDKIDRESWNALCELVKDGNAVVVFPEGTRTETGELQKAKPGSGMLIYRARAVVVPAYVNSFDVWPKSQRFPSLGKTASVIFGPPIYLADELAMPHSRQAYEAIANKVMDEIRKLKKELEKLSKES